MKTESEENQEPTCPIEKNAMTNVRRESLRVVKIGLNQIPIDGLERLRDHIKEGNPVLLNGGLVTDDGKMAWPMVIALPVGSRTIIMTSDRNYTNREVLLRQIWERLIGNPFEPNPVTSAVCYATAISRFTSKDVLEIVEELIDKKRKK